VRRNRSRRAAPLVADDAEPLETALVLVGNFVVVVGPLASHGAEGAVPLEDQSVQGAPTEVVGHVLEHAELVRHHDLRMGIQE
jgi:hypothetical protein